MMENSDRQKETRKTDLKCNRCGAKRPIVIRQPCNCGGAFVLESKFYDKHVKIRDLRKSNGTALKYHFTLQVGTFQIKDCSLNLENGSLSLATVRGKGKSRHLASAPGADINRVRELVRKQISQQFSADDLLLGDTIQAQVKAVAA
jgi:hypothetical protein